MSDLHLFDVSGQGFLYQSGSMRLFRLAPALYSFLKSGKPETPWVLRQGRALCVALENSIPVQTPADANWYTLNFILTHSCNLRCVYCFDRGSAGQVGALPFSQAHRALEQISQRHKKLCIAFFGGEPLIRFDQIRRITELCQRMLTAGVLDHVTYSVTSNGRLLTGEMADFFNEHHFSFTLSADGCQEQEARGAEYYKCFPDENPFLRQLNGYVVRATVTPETIDEIYQQYCQFRHRGVRSVAFFPAVGEEICYSPEDAARWISQMERLVPEAYQAGSGCTLGDIDAAVTRLRQRRKKRDCLAEDFMACVDTDGSQYACHRMVGMGRHFQKACVPLIDRQPSGVDCTLCWAKDFCLGLCGYERLLASPQTCGFLCSIYGRQAELACWVYSRHSVFR